MLSESVFENLVATRLRLRRVYYGNSGGGFLQQQSNFFLFDHQPHSALVELALSGYIYAL